ncbi:EutN/CcmL family microcompartment protein [Blautia liquoris]|uniref:EutN/CcmL family microcompartment protein n=1 Tax=Blautia liquoris TaxID=2779518 RepID=A0A7M2RKI4_9FIRM|nr:EutN/CcmL family microcompartment protein [Blautia liquoris]QOV19862.1 EutN/CcmL family microcompartment protein [Blautia liquoris]
MKTGRVIGNIWATRKAEDLEGLKLMVIQPINLLDDEPIDNPIVAADIIGAGVGEKVLYVGGSSARTAAGSREIPVDATIVGIVDDQEIDEDQVHGKR